MYYTKFYPKTKAYGKTFEDVRQFLLKHNEMLKNIHFHWSRWEWMFARDSFKTEDLSLITLFMKDNQIKGLLSIEDEPGVYFLVYDDNQELKDFIINYMVENNIQDDIIIPNDEDMKQRLLSLNYEQTDWIDPVTRLNDGPIELPETPGYDIVSLEEDYRLDQIHHALWRGFDHGDDVDYSKQNLEDRRHMTSSPNFKKYYTYVAVHNNQYVSYAGIWYEKGTKTALIEPVATVPEHRKKHLARACIYHAIQRAKNDGATDIFVGSNRSVYLNMGFQPFDNAIRFKKTDN
jgi:GNAT superfamily N-acetyltransferase